MDDWEVIVEPMPPQQADELFAAWKCRNAERVARLAPEDVLRDLIRGIEGDLVRYRVRIQS